LGGRGLAAFAALIGLLSLGENLLGWNLGIDQMVAQEAPGAMGVGALNLMGTPAATSFLLAGPALLILGRRDSRGAKAGHGLALAESYGHGWNTPFHPDDQQRAWETWKHATQDEAPCSMECRLRRADGIYRWWLMRGEPMRGANGEIMKWFGTCTDIDEFKQAAEQLRRIMSELMVTELRERKRLAQVLHDGLQQDLVAAKFRLALLERGKDIKQTTEQIRELIDDAIETSRSLSAELSPLILLQGNFIAALEWTISH